MSWAAAPTSTCQPDGGCGGVSSICAHPSGGPGLGERLRAGPADGAVEFPPNQLIATTSPGNLNIVVLDSTVLFSPAGSATGRRRSLLVAPRLLHDVAQALTASSTGSWHRQTPVWIPVEGVDEAALRAGRSPGDLSSHTAIRYVRLGAQLRCSDHQMLAGVAPLRQRQPRDWQLIPTVSDVLLLSGMLGDASLWDAVGLPDRRPGAATHRPHRPGRFRARWQQTYSPERRICLVRPRQPLVGRYRCPRMAARLKERRSPAQPLMNASARRPVDRAQQRGLDSVAAHRRRAFRRGRRGLCGPFAGRMRRADRGSIAANGHHGPDPSAPTGSYVMTPRPRVPTAKQRDQSSRSGRLGEMDGDLPPGFLGELVAPFAAPNSRRSGQRAHAASLECPDGLAGNFSENEARANLTGMRRYALLSEDERQVNQLARPCHKHLPSGHPVVVLYEVSCRPQATHDSVGGVVGKRRPQNVAVNTPATKADRQVEVARHHAIPLSRERRIRANTKSLPGVLGGIEAHHLPGDVRIGCQTARYYQPSCQSRCMAVRSDIVTSGG